MDSIISLYNYLLLNAALIIGYVITRLILSSFLFKHKSLQIRRLIFARYSFTALVSTFYIGSIIAKLLPFVSYSNFRLGPIVKIVSSPFTQTQKGIADKITSIGSVYTLPTINKLIGILLISGIIIFLAKYINNMMQLKRIKDNSFCRHRFNHIYVLFNHTVAIPFCWSLFKNHYVVIPTPFLEKSEHLRLIIRHELQHIRQFDTHWLHFLTIMKIICFWNPVMKLWIKWFDELQEFSCDEALMLRKKTSAAAYGQCLIDAATGLFENKILPQTTLGIHRFSSSILYRRVNMLFEYTPLKQKKLSLIMAYIITTAITATTSIAFAASQPLSMLSAHQVAILIKQSHLDKELQVSANPEVVNELNNIRSSAQARSFMQASLQRMKKYQLLVENALTKRGMPKDLSVIPLVESGYQPLDESKNPVKAAGIWQIIPSTAKQYGLTIDGKQDQRMDFEPATRAALQLLNEDHKIYNNWKLAFVAYEIGEEKTTTLIKATSSRDAWVLANSPKAPPNLKKTLATFDAELIIMHNPSLIAENS